MALQFDVQPEIEKAIRALFPEIRTMMREEIEAALREKLLTVDEAARLAGTSAAALRKRIARGLVPVVRAGRTVRVRAADILEGAS